MNRQIQVFNYEGTDITFEKIGNEVMMNATDCARKYGKKVVEWLRLPSTIEYMNAIKNKYSNVGKSHIWETRRGNNGGTWLPQLAIIEFARWCNVDFAVWCNEIVLQLMTTGHVEVQTMPKAKQVSASAAKAAMIFIKGAKDMLRLSDASVAAMYNKAAETYDLPVAIDYVPSKGNLVTSSFIASQLNISANALNKRLEAAGLIERKTRQSHKGEKHFWCLTEKGLVYGENQVNPKNPNETFPKFYEKSMGDIINLIKN